MNPSTLPYAPPISPPSPTRRFSVRRRGLGLIEALISLAIVAALLTATATAFIAASSSVRDNTDFASATQTARAAMIHLENELRRGVPDASVSLDSSGSTHSVRLLSASSDAADRTYIFNDSSGTLVLRSNSTGSETLLARNISTGRFFITKGSDASGQTAVTAVNIEFTVRVGRNAVNLSGSAIPRKSLAR